LFFLFSYKILKIFYIKSIYNFLRNKKTGDISPAPYQENLIQLFFKHEVHCTYHTKKSIDIVQSKLLF